MKLEKIPPDKVVALHPIGYADHVLYPVREMCDSGIIFRGSIMACANFSRQHNLVVSADYSNQDSLGQLRNVIKKLENPKKSKRDIEIVELARDTIEKEGEIEFDDDAKVSEDDDNGAYVQAWVWVSFSGTKFDKEKDKD